MRKLGPVEALDIIQDPQGPWVILFHGYGADAGDLASLADVLPVKKPCNFLFPQGFLEVPIGPGWTGRAWWELDMMKLQRDIEAGVERDTGAEVPAGLGKARQKAMAMIEALAKTLNAPQNKIPWDRLILGGFSQGGMIAADLALHAPEKPRGLVLLSTAIINKAEMKKIAPSKAGLEFFQSHGDQDMVLSHKNAARLETLLTQSGLKGKLRTFRGGHEIPAGIITELGAWLDQRL